jgi:hypothetical protein
MAPGSTRSGDFTLTSARLKVGVALKAGFVAVEPVKTLFAEPLPQSAAVIWRFPLASVSTQREAVVAPVHVANWVVFPVTVPTEGATPAPPPITGRFAVNAALVAHVVEPEK